jgi:hypothetical protein
MTIRWKYKYDVAKLITLTDTLCSVRYCSFFYFVNIYNTEIMEIKVTHLNQITSKLIWDCHQSLIQLADMGVSS